MLDVQTCGDMRICLGHALSAEIVRVGGAIVWRDANFVGLRRHFARNEGRVSKTGVSLQSLKFRCNPFARNEGQTVSQTAKTGEELRF